MLSARSKIEAVFRYKYDGQDFIDALVHEQASAMATAINNNGLKAQLEFLNARGVTDEEVLSSLTDMSAV